MSPASPATSATWPPPSEQGNERAELALQMFAYKVKQYIGAYAAALNGVDAIVFTAGVGENDRRMREMILTDMEYLGVDVDFAYNQTCPRGEEVEISKPGSRVPRVCHPDGRRDDHRARQPPPLRCERKYSILTLYLEFGGISI